MIYLRLFLAFFKIGLFGFGGGAAMLPVIYSSARSLGTMTPAEFSNLVGISQMTPGPIAVNAATYVGYLTAGLPGALVATFSVALPSFILITLVSYFITKFRESEAVNGALYGVRPMTAGLVLAAVMFMGQQAVGGGTQMVGILSLVICIASFVLTGKKNVNPLVVIAGAGVIGALFMA